MGTGQRVCATCGAVAADPVCPSCGTSHRVLPALLAGVVPAGPGAHAAAAGIDVGVAVLLLGSALVSSAGLRATLLLLAVTWATGVWVGRGRAGRTPGALALGLRIVDADTGLPVGLADVPLTPASRALVLDVRQGRDPTRTVATEVHEALAAVPGANRPAEPDVGHDLPTRAVPTVRPVSRATTWHGGVGHPVGSSATLVLELDDGERVPVDGVVLLGRSPTPRPDERVDRLVPLHDLSRTVSKTHARVRREGGTVWLQDRGSTNGTLITERSGRTTEVTDVEIAVPIGAQVRLGDRSLVLRHEAGDETVLRPARHHVPRERRP